MSKARVVSVVVGGGVNEALYGCYVDTSKSVQTSLQTPYS